MAWVSEKSEEDHLAAITKNLLAALEVPYDEATVARDLLERASYPALGSLLTALDRWGLACAAVEVDAQGLAELPMPLVARLHQDRYALVLGVDDRSVTLVDGRGPARTASRDDFLATWTGAVVVAEGGPEARAYTPASQRAERRANAARAGWVGGAVVLLGLVGLAISRSGAHAARLGMLASLDLGGLVASSLLAATSLGAAHVTRALCEGGRRTSCQRVLGSPAARLGPVEMSDLGVIYFGGSLLALWLVIGGASTQVVELMQARALLAALSLPYTLFSIGYQVWLRSFCPLCLIVVGVLWLELAVLAGPLAELSALPLDGAARTAAALLLAALAWLPLKPYLRKALSEPALRRRELRLRRDPHRVERSLGAPTEMPSTTLQMEEGDEGAPVTLTVYSDLLCDHCAETHEALHAHLERGHVRVRHRLFAFLPLDDRARSMARALARHLAAGRVAESCELLSAWFAARREHRRLPSGESSVEGDAAALYEGFLASASAPPFPGAPVVFVDGRPLSPSTPVTDLDDWIAARVRQAEN